MNAFDLIKEKTAYNEWANRIAVEWLQQHPIDVYKQEVKSSFPSINKLLHHLMEAEKYYFSILRGVEEEYEELMPTEKIIEELQRIDTELIDWLSQQSPDEMARTISLKRSPVLETYSVATLMTHLVNHSTYHRGQLIALRHQLALAEAPRLDYYRYIIARSNKPFV